MGAPRMGTTSLRRNLPAGSTLEARGSQMVRLKIMAAGRPASPGDFGAAIEGSALVLPEEIAAVFRSYGIDDVLGMLAYVDAFPSTIARDLHWSVSDVQH